MIKYGFLGLLFVCYAAGSDTSSMYFIKDEKKDLKKINNSDFELLLNNFKKKTGYGKFEQRNDFNKNTNAETTKRAPSKTKKKQNNNKKKNAETTKRAPSKTKKKQNNNKKKNDDDKLINMYIDQDKNIKQQPKDKVTNNKPQNRNRSIQESLNFFGIVTELGEIKNIDSQKINEVVSLWKNKKIKDALHIFKTIKMAPEIYNKIISFMFQNSNEMRDQIKQEIQQTGKMIDLFQKSLEELNKQKSTLTESLDPYNKN